MDHKNSSLSLIKTVQQPQIKTIADKRTILYTELITVKKQITSLDSAMAKNAISLCWKWSIQDMRYLTMVKKLLGTYLEILRAREIKLKKQLLKNIQDV